MQDTSRRGFIVRLKPNEAAIVFMLGEPYRLVTQPGIHFIVPVFDLARIFPVYLANLQDPRSWAATLKSEAAIVFMSQLRDFLSERSGLWANPIGW